MIAQRGLLLSLLATASLIASAAQATPITASLNGYDLVKVGNPGNAAQVSANANQNGFGAVATDFWIGKYEVTIGQYTEFLNAVAQTNNRGLYNANMNNDQRVRGIVQSGSSGSFVYTVAGPNGTNPTGAASGANRPITFVSWFDSARFANWMANGKPTGAAGSTTTDNGAYNLGVATTGDAVALNTTNPNTGGTPTFSIPTENQWYKAAYYSPVKGGPSTPGYFLYGTSSDATPGNGWNGTAALASKDLANQVNTLFNGRSAVTGTGVVLANGNQNYLTDVGGFTNTYSYYGAFDMSGNAIEWIDLAGTPGPNNAIRGAAWDVFHTASSSSTNRATFATTSEFASLGFRLASPVPEPGTMGMAAGGVLVAGWWWVLKRRGRART